MNETAQLITGAGLCPLYTSTHVSSVNTVNETAQLVTGAGLCLYTITQCLVQCYNAITSMKLLPLSRVVVWAYTPSHTVSSVTMLSHQSNCSACHRCWAVLIHQHTLYPDQLYDKICHASSAKFQKILLPVKPYFWQEKSGFQRHALSEEVLKSNIKVSTVNTDHHLGNDYEWWFCNDGISGMDDHSKHVLI